MIKDFVHGKSVFMFLSVCFLSSIAHEYYTLDFNYPPNLSPSAFMRLNLQLQLFSKDDKNTLKIPVKPWIMQYLFWKKYDTASTRLAKDAM